MWKIHKLDKIGDVLLHKKCFTSLSPPGHIQRDRRTGGVFQNSASIFFAKSLT